MGYRQIGGSSPTPTPTPTAATRTFDTTETSGTPNNFGLSAGKVDVTSGAGGNGLGSAQAFNTTTAALDGLIFVIAGQNRQGALNVYFDGVLKCTSIPFNANASTFAVVDLPIRVPSGTAVSAAIATTTGTTAFNCSVVGYQSSVASTVTSIAALGSAATIATQGVTLSTASAWAEVGTLSAAAKGLLIHVGNAGAVTSRTAGLLLIGIGTGASTAEQVLIPNNGAWSATNNVIFREQTFRLDIANNTRLVARAKMFDGTLPNAVNVQLAIMY